MTDAGLLRLMTWVVLRNPIMGNPGCTWCSVINLLPLTKPIIMPEDKLSEGIKLPANGIA